MPVEVGKSYGSVGNSTSRIIQCSSDSLKHRSCDIRHECICEHVKENDTAASPLVPVLLERGRFL